MSNLQAPGISVTDSGPAIARLLFVADAAVADVHDLPPVVRATLDSAGEVHVVTPALPGRLAWLADDVDGLRHVADERLDVVLDHMSSIGGNAHGFAGRGSLLAVIADAVTSFAPDHILLALQTAEHANWQERRLVEHIEGRYGLPVTTYAVDSTGHTAAADGPLLLCYDGSADAVRAIKRAGTLFPGRSALVTTVWQEPLTSLGRIGWLDETPSMPDLGEIDREATENAGRVAAEGVRVAERAGLSAQPLVVRGQHPIWRTIVEVADRHDAAAIVMGSRGLTGLRSKLMGSVSNAVVNHAARPTLIIRRP
jgi:nucleotide-binding universal stress UspA family protein